ncbi:uroporphyrinogen-III synthase [Chryseobacterium salipaludis]|uniref:uroporphyrinogen-III synthase n=1 Tax=Chryseobacterium TaxID=59732 RepID=UPI001FF3E2D8|nr:MULTISPECIES: uroporphyrinogen-III synthase [Chryseobacterium]MCJ8497457.1 uroporphyrinogen-III synthase [Chryseobacterium salipaludis]MCX3295865.1 uroporphyrinogen-III synthase [Planobacterium sp. JC490]
MKVLFTKQLDQQEVLAVLGNDFETGFLDVIGITHRKVAPFPLGNKSLIFTSVNGVDAFFKNGFHANENFAGRNFNKIYCVGQKTKKQLRKNGFGVYKMKKNALELSEFITESATGEAFVHFCGNLALDILQKKLPLQNIPYQKVVVYDTELLYPKNEERYDAIAFFSPSGVRSFIKNNTLNFKYIFSIGETTSAEIKKYTDQTIFTSRQNDLQAVLELIRQQGPIAEAHQ